jgi:NitT/TauT family transport system permease protein
MRTRLRQLLIMALPPLTLFILLIVIWQITTGLASVPSFLLPAPARVSQAAWLHRWDLLRATGLTAAAALGGLAISLAVGMVVAVAFSQSAIVRRSVYPYAIFLQTVPSVALAPLVIIWFGPGFASVVVVAFIISLFPIITNATTGLLDLDRNLVELFTMSSASRRQVLTKLQLPNSIPYLIAGAKISCGLSVIGAIVGEFTAGYGESAYGLGYLIIATSGRLQLDYLFAATLAAMLLGVVFFGAISLVGDWILRRWHAPGSAGEAQSFR